MATMTETPEAIAKQEKQTPWHDYHADAHVLSGHLQRPVKQKIEPHAPVSLRDERGGHLTRFAEDVSIEGLISFRKGQTRVSGSRSLKHNGWVTLSTSVLEGLNVFEVITADRIVSQVSTEHPYQNGHFPKVTFLGTQFDNLRVSGFPVELKLDFGICGKKPDGDKSYLDDLTFLKGVRDQTARIANADGLPKEVKDQYDEKLANIENLISIRDGGRQGTHEPKVTCSLVQSIGEIPIPGVKSFGHVLLIPEFGALSLGEIEVGEKLYDSPERRAHEGQTPERPSNYFTLSIIKMKLGCVGQGDVTAGTATANGAHKP
jgi:hypothetical protein